MAFLQGCHMFFRPRDLLHEAVDDLDLRLQQLGGKFLVNPGILESF